MKFQVVSLVLASLLGVLQSCKKGEPGSDTASLVSKNTNGTSDVLVTTMLNSDPISLTDASESNEAGTLKETLTVDELAAFNAPQYCWYTTSTALTASQLKDFYKTVGEANKGIDGAINKYASSFRRVNQSPLSISGAKEMIGDGPVTQTDLENSVSQTLRENVSSAKMKLILNGISKAQEGTGDPCPDVTELGQPQQVLPDEAIALNLSSQDSACSGANVMGNGVDKCCTYARSQIGDGTWISRCFVKKVKRWKTFGKGARARSYYRTVRTQVLTGYWIDKTNYGP